MSHEFKLTTQDGTSYYFPETKTPLRNETWITNSQWGTVFDAIDGKNEQNRQITQKEISLFLNDVEKASGENKTLELKELKQLAVKYKTTASNMANALATLSGVLVANNIDSKFASWSSWLGDSTKDLEGAEKAINEQINPNNVVSILGHKPEITKKIVENFEPEKAIPLLDKIFNDLKTIAKESGIEFNKQAEIYTSAKENQDVNSMQRAINQIVQYIRNDYETDVAIANHNPTHRIIRSRMPDSYIKKPIAITDENSQKIVSEARAKGAEVTNDLVGDGVIGNTKSVATTQAGQLVMNALNELLQDDVFKEKFTSCYKKEHNRLVLYWPKDDRNFTSTENGLITQKNENTPSMVQKGVVGDGDMTLVVAAILKRLESEGQDVQAMTKDDLKQYLLKKFE